MMSLSPWPPPPAAPQLAAHEVHVWRVRLDGSTDQLARDEALLAPDERARMQAARSVRGRRHFAGTRATLRRILSQYLGLPPAQILLETTPLGKPQVAPVQNPRDLHFNVAHSGAVALYAVACGRRVGVDVERVRANVPVERVAGRYFAPGEVAALLALPVAQRRAGFFSGWTRKEAYCKARGRGLSQGLGSFEVSMSPGETLGGQSSGQAGDRLLHSDLGAAEVARWLLCELDVEGGYRAALAVEIWGELPTLQKWQIDKQTVRDFEE